MLWNWRLSFFSFFALWRWWTSRPWIHCFTFGRIVTGFNCGFQCQLRNRAIAFLVCNKLLTVFRWPGQIIPTKCYVICTTFISEKMQREYFDCLINRKFLIEKLFFLGLPNTTMANMWNLKWPEMTIVVVVKTRSITSPLGCFLFNFASLYQSRLNEWTRWRRRV